MQLRRASLVSMGAIAALLAPLAASAHETQQFRIGGKTYNFVVGSINEPVTVDDKSGVEVLISEVGGGVDAAVDHGDGDEHGAGTPVAGLEQTLKVEVSAGNKKREFDLRPSSGVPGEYRAVFFPTVQTTYTYRFIGTINNTPVDLPFTCNPAGHPVTPEDTAEQAVGDTVTRILKRGAFGCPSAKADLGFPEPSATIAEVQQKNGSGTASVALALGALGTALGLAAMKKKRG